MGVRRRVGYLPEDHAFPGYHTGYSLMDFYGSLYGVPPAERQKRIPETLEQVGIAGRMHYKIKTYSKGMKQRLGIAQALMHEPDLIILDEPTDGVDPIGRREIRELMTVLKEKGHTIFLNSHLLGEVELICDRVAILQQGKLVREGTIAELTKTKGTFILGLLSGQTFPVEAVAKLGFAVRALPEQPGLFEITLTDGQTIEPVTKHLSAAGLTVTHIVEKKQSLEDVFMTTVEGAEPGVDRNRRLRPAGRGEPVRQFIAILKDSFREAADGFVIYAMLVMSLIAIVLIGSLSFTPAEPKPAFDRIVGYFDDMVINDPLTNNGRIRGFLRPYARFAAQDVRPEGDGFKVRVTVAGQPSRTFTDEKLEEIRKEEAKKAGKDEPKKDEPKRDEPKKDEPKKDDKKDEPKKKPERLDGFRELVLAWQKTNPERNELPFMRETPVTLGEVQGVTDAQMEAYVKKQFEFHAGMSVTVTRVPGVAEPEYAFDVTTTGGTSVRGWPHKVNILFNTFTWPTTQSLGETVYWLQDKVVNGVGAALALLISLVLTSFYIPNMLRKGSIDLLISKPLGRSQLLVYKYVGGLTFIFLLTAFTVFGVWLVLGVRSGIWDPNFLVVIPVLTFTFAILYAVSTLAAVLTRSAIVAILVSVAFAAFLYIVGLVKTVTDTLKANEEVKKEMPGWVFTLVDTLNNILPRYKDLDKLTTKVLSGSLTPAEMRACNIDVLDFPSWGSTVGVSVLFIAFVLSLACWRLNRRDG